MTSVGLCDVFLPSLDDVQAVSGLEFPEDIVQWSHRMGAPLVVLKVGKSGALVSDGIPWTSCDRAAIFRVFIG